MINTATFHQNNFRLTQALGAKLNAGDATFQPIGFDGLYLLIKQFPHPTVAGGDSIEVPMAGGGVYLEQAPLRTAFEGPVSIHETEAGTAKQFFRDVLATGGYFNGRIFEGTPARFVRSYLVERCWIQIDTSDRDWENRGTLLTLTGTLRGNYFGDERPGNI